MTSTRRKVGLVFGALVMVASGMAVATSPAGAAFPGINGRISCGSNRTADSEIFLFNPDATESGVTNISNSPGRCEGRPRWRSHGRKIAFESSRAGGTNIFIADADGSNVQQVTFTNDAPSPAWHPDGSQIGYQRNFGALNFDVYKVNIDGSAPTPVSPTPQEDSLPFWNPEGTTIVFNSRRLEGNAAPPDIYTMDSLGNNVVNVTNLPGVKDAWPNWSPDGTQLVFHSCRNDPTGEEVYRMPATGGPATRLTFNNVSQTDHVTPTVFDIFPAYSPTAPESSGTAVGARRPSA